MIDPEEDDRIYSKHYDNGLRQYHYGPEVKHDDLWTDELLKYRGIIKDKKCNTVARPFDKFFNVGERENTKIEVLRKGRGKPDYVMEKYDGSMIILFHWNNDWHVHTKMSKISDQVQWTKKKLSKHDVYQHLNPRCTYILEAVYPRNRIVVDYEEEHLFLIGIKENLGAGDVWIDLPPERIDERGEEIPYIEGPEWKENTKTLTELQSEVKSYDPENSEGKVLLWGDSEITYRAKLKVPEWFELKRKYEFTPLSLWEAMERGKVNRASIKDIPEFKKDRLMKIISKLEEEHKKIVKKALEYWRGISDLSRPEMDRYMKEDKHTPEEIKRLVWPLENDDKEAFHETIKKMIRPKGNNLENIEIDF